MNHLALRYDARRQAWRLELVADRNVLIETPDQSDIERIARGIAAWTQLPIVETR
jgi:hypothetical protein